MRKAHLLCGVLALFASAASATLNSGSVQDDCMQYAKRLGSVKERHCNIPGWYRSGGVTNKGRSILLRDIPGDALAPRVLVIGGIHGDELASVSIVFDWIERLAKQNAQRVHWRITPSMNPDGLLDRPSTRTNARGVDLNRNLPTHEWEDTALRYWVERTGRSERRYPGPSALSEPETQWLTEELQRFQPDVIVAVHAPLGNIDFDGPAQAPQRIGPLYLNLLGTYPGSLGNFAGVQKGIPVLTVELSSAGIMPTERQKQAIWSDLDNWLQTRFRKPAHNMGAEAATGVGAQP